jgi:glycosyltransferase involved in cell wall biosynthesis
MNNIHFLTSKFSERRASHRLRGKLIAEELQKRNISASVGTKISNLQENDIAVWIKFSQLENILESKKRKAITIFDICDNKFDEDPSLLPCALEADYLTCNTQSMVEEILKRTGKVATVIPDPFERPILPVKFSPEKTIKILWFGSNSSLGYVNWTEIWSYLERNIGRYELSIVSGKAKRFEEKTRSRLKNPDHKFVNMEKIHFVEWDWETQGAYLEYTDVVLIPIEGNHRTITKSSTRLIDSLASGKFVITSRIPSYDEFKDFIWTKNYAKGLVWALDKHNRKQIYEMITQGQQYVIENYSVSKITDKWLNFFKTLSHDIK